MFPFLWKWSLHDSQSPLGAPTGKPVDSNGERKGDKEVVIEVASHGEQ
jgi:hypothetical protein